MHYYHTQNPSMLGDSVYVSKNMPWRTSGVRGQPEVLVLPFHLGWNRDLVTAAYTKLSWLPMVLEFSCVAFHPSLEDQGYRCAAPCLASHVFFGSEFPLTLCTACALLSELSPSPTVTHSMYMSYEGTLTLNIFRFVSYAIKPGKRLKTLSLRPKWRVISCQPVTADTRLFQCLWAFKFSKLCCILHSEHLDITQAWYPLLFSGLPLVLAVLCLRGRVRITHMPGGGAYL